MWYAFAVVVFIDGTLVSDSPVFGSQADCMDAQQEVKQAILKNDRVREFYLADCRKAKLGPKA